MAQVHGVSESQICGDERRCEVMSEPCPHCKGNKTIGWRLIEIVAGESKGPYFIASGARCEFVPIQCPVCNGSGLQTPAGGGDITPAAPVRDTLHE